ncbi:MAG: esterase-like activity of phytase family protein [Caulobacter sp.]
MSALLRLSLLASLSLLAGVAQAQPTEHRVPHLASSVPVTATLDGLKIINHGLVGVGRLPAATRDFNGDSLGSFSAMAVVDWRRGGDGRYEGEILTLPDRGPNAVGEIKGTSDYANRLHRFSVRFAPAASGAPDQMTLTPRGGVLLKDAKGQGFTGLDPSEPAAAGRISLDSEGLARAKDGAFWVSDEYAAAIYRFDASGKAIGMIPPVAAVAPMKAGQPHPSGASPTETGRRANQGLEGLSLTPDGKRLVALLQSATLQDSVEGKDETRANTRLFIYDVSTKAAPTTPLAHYVVQLPVFRNKGDGGAPDKTAAQSELLALSEHQFLVLARDGNGRGGGATRAAVYRAVLLIDTSGATNLAGTPYETSTKPIAPAGVLDAGVIPARQVELINFNDPSGMARFGLNLDNRATNAFTLPEKLEAMALVPALDPKAPDDVFLLIGSDNDFQTASGTVGGLTFDAGVRDAEGKPAGDNENLILVYRLTIPGWSKGRAG